MRLVAITAALLLASAHAAPTRYKRQDEAAVVTEDPAPEAPTADGPTVPPTAQGEEAVTTIATGFALSNPAVLVSKAAESVAAAESPSSSPSSVGFSVLSSSTLVPSSTSVEVVSSSTSSPLSSLTTKASKTSTSHNTRSSTSAAPTRVETTDAPTTAESQSTASSSSTAVVAVAEKGGISSAGAIAGIVLAVIGLLLSPIALTLWLKARRAPHNYNRVVTSDQGTGGYRKPSEEIRMSVLSDMETASLADHAPPSRMTEHYIRDLDASNNARPATVQPPRADSSRNAQAAGVASPAPLGEPRSPLAQVFDWGAQRDLALKTRRDAEAGITTAEPLGVRLRDGAEGSEPPLPPRFVPAAGSWKRGTFGPTVTPTASASSASDKQSGESDPTLVSRLEQSTPEESPVGGGGGFLSPGSVDSVYSTSAETAVHHFPGASSSRHSPGVVSITLPALPETTTSDNNVWVTTPAITLTDPTSSTAMLAHTASRRRSAQIGQPRLSLQPAYHEAQGHGRAESTGRYPVAYHHGSLGGRIDLHGVDDSRTSSTASDAADAAIITLPRRRWSGASRQWRVIE